MLTGGATSDGYGATDGIAIAGTHIPVPVTNQGNQWLSNVKCSVVIPGHNAADVHKQGPPLAPGLMLPIPCAIPPPSPSVICERDGNDAYVSVMVAVTAQACDDVKDSASGKKGNGCIQIAAPKLQHRLRCRSLNQSFLFTFLDHDGSAQSAAAIAPLPLGTLPKEAGKSKKGKGKKTASSTASESTDPPPLLIDGVESVPILLSLHGTGVSAGSQADAYKVKPPGASGPNDPYIFGVEGYWLLAPSRHGAHNHQGTGQWHARTAVRALAQLVARLRSAGDGSACSVSGVGSGRNDRGSHWRSLLRCLPLPDPLRVLFSGHSMGGAGECEGRPSTV